MVEKQYDLVIISPKEFIPSLKPLEAHKNGTGMATFMASLEDIFRKYPGRDEAEKVKRFLAHFRKDHGIRFAMLVGDSEKFPVRYTKYNRLAPETYDTAFLPADLYYADLFKTDGAFDDWDRNKNGYYGELHGESLAGKVNIDELDLRPDIAVGRVPASTPEEVSTYVSKVISHEINAGITGWLMGWSKRALLLATTDWTDDPSFACKVQSEIAKSYLKDYTVDKLFSLGNPCKKTPAPGPGEINSRLNQGVGFICYIGHGSKDEWSGIYGVQDLAGLNNADKLPVIFAAACGTSMFAADPPYKPYVDIVGNYHRGTDRGEVFTSTPPQPACIQTNYNPDGFCENITVKRNTGAIGYVGCITGAQPDSKDLAKAFFEGLWLGHETLGGLWNFMQQRYYEIHIPPLIIDPPDWQKLAEFHQPWKFFLFGDPSLRIFGISAITTTTPDCISFDPRQAEVRKSDGTWEVIGGGSILLEFGDQEVMARRALDIIRFYNISRMCYVGRPDPSLEYSLADDHAPVGPYPPWDNCNGFNPAAITIKKVKGRWKIVEGSNWLLDFKDKEDEARAAFKVIQKYGFNHICIVGGHQSPWIYFRR